MRYWLIKKDDMLNGTGLRVTLFVDGCCHYCKGCHNPETWDTCTTKDNELCREFTLSIKEEMFKYLDHPYINGITLSGGDPLYSNNLYDIHKLILEIKERFPDKTIWLYTGYVLEDIINTSNDSDMVLRQEIIKLCNVIVDGKFKEELADLNYPYAGSTNQRVIEII